MIKSFAKGIQDVGTKLIFGSEKVTSKMSFYDLVDTKMNGSKVPMSTYKGNVLLVVNVASKWGLTKKNYTQLPKLVDKYGPRGFKVLAFPCNQFGGQEPGTNEQILAFVEKFDAREKLEFFEKGDVNGKGTREVFSFLKRELGQEDIRWNFAKFLVDADGKPYKRYSPQTDPDDIIPDIEELLTRKEGQKKKDNSE